MSRARLNKEWFKNNRTDNPKLMTKPLKNGTESIYLYYVYGYTQDIDGTGKVVTKVDRKKEFLHLYLISKPSTPFEKKQNEEVIKLAIQIKNERGQQVLEDKEGYRVKQNNKVDFLAYAQDYINAYKKADIRVVEMAMRDFRKFITEHYPRHANKIEPKRMTTDMMKQFAEYLKDTHRGTGVHSVYQRFKKIINQGVEDGIFTKSPCRGVSVERNEDMLLKDVLTQEEIAQLFATHYPRENPEIRRAFALTCFCGIRFCDINNLRFSDIDYSNRLLQFRQSKTGKGVTIQLNDTTLYIIGIKPQGAEDDYIFHLPSSTMCLKALRNWTKRAGIDKHITWHCGRHSFATNILTNGANIKVVAELMGHSTITYTQVYARALDQEKKRALDSLQAIDINNI